MLVQADLQRSIKNMTLSLSRATQKRAHAGDWHELGEWEQQYQYEFSGFVGTLPVETHLILTFGVAFVADAGNQRDSILDRPQVRLGFEFEYAPAGTIPYAHVAAWIQDDDFNYVGADVMVGVHCPAVAINAMVMALEQARFKVAFHIGFQGFGTPTDPEGGLDAGGSQDL